MPEHRSPSDSRLSVFSAAAASRGIPLPTILASVAVVALVYLAGQLIYRIRDIILIVIIAGFVALVLNPFVVALQHWHLKRRGQAVAVVALIAVLAFIALAFAFGYPLVNGLTHLADRLPTYIRQAEHGKGWIGRLVRKYHVESWVNKNAPKLTSFAKNLAKPALQLGKGALTLLVTVFTVFALVLLLLLEGSKLRTGLIGLMSAERANRYTRVAGEVNRSVTGYVLGDLLTSLIAGIVVFVALALLGVPFPLLWALWVALVDFIPVVGGALAGIPTVLFAAAHSLSAGVATLVVFLAYTLIENHVLNPVVMSRTVRINPLLVLLSILVGASIGSWIGSSFGAFVLAVVSIPIAGAIQVVIGELWRATAPDEPSTAPTGQVSTTQGT
jgi:predicted PurR-regulated permease PerM